MLEKDLINNLLKVFKTSDKIEDYKELVIQALNYLSSGSKEHILAILQTDFYEIIFESLSSSNEIIQLNSLAIINNCISIFNFEIATKLIENGLIEKIFNILDLNDKNFQKILMLIKIFDSTIELGKYQLSDEDDSLLTFKDKNSYLESFIKMGGIEKLDELQKIPNENIYNKTVEFIEKYFNTDDD